MDIFAIGECAQLALSLLVAIRDALARRDGAANRRELSAILGLHSAVLGLLEGASDAIAARSVDVGATTATYHDRNANKEFEEHVDEFYRALSLVNMQAMDICAAQLSSVLRHIRSYDVNWERLAEEATRRLGMDGQVIQKSASGIAHAVDRHLAREQTWVVHHSEIKALQSMLSDCQRKIAEFIQQHWTYKEILGA